ncbi:Vimentin, putative [Pediculus humanus corporis]|uniref:Vimentin, putative n=1 Tax=Pediculus humanus subsp. corporis TaxID=121224 RepID=E0VMP7_PEDHC|nr:Vimentin, putative [Pediculus humanus corporis]EEB14653.1 Vimentin, putative [Pediculus humanus corporis]
MEQPEVELSVVDVYDIASEIGKEFEKIIDGHGPDIVMSLMPKVIYALEHLENFSLQNEKENTIVQDLKSKITKLELEKIEKAEDQKRFERELEQIEDHWKSETKDLVEVLGKVQEENKRLRGTVADQKNLSASNSTIATEVDIVVLQRLKAMVDSQREQIRNKEKELANKVSELESLTTEVDRLTKTGRELRRKHKIVQNQVRTLIEERADFITQLQDQQKEIVTLKQNLGVAEKENEDLTKNSIVDLTNKAVFDLDDPDRPRFTTSELKEILQERNELRAKISDLEDELELYRPKGTTENDTDAPVQGPLPYEPDDAPWKKTSGTNIRKL